MIFKVTETCEPAKKVLPGKQAVSAVQQLIWKLLKNQKEMEQL